MLYLWHTFTCGNNSLSKHVKKAPHFLVDGHGREFESVLTTLQFFVTDTPDSYYQPFSVGTQDETYLLSRR